MNHIPQEDLCIIFSDDTANTRTPEQMAILLAALRRVAQDHGFDLQSSGSRTAMRRFLLGEQRSRRYPVTLKALLSGRPEDAAHTLANFAPYRPQGLWEQAPDIHHYEVLVAMVLRGQGVVVEVETQKDLLALTGHFWVEPRVLPEDEKEDQCPSL